MFSSRLPARLEVNTVSRAIARRRAAGATLLDLTITNPTEVGISYPAGVLSSLCDDRADRYAPEPLGWPEARAAVAAEAATPGTLIAPSQIVLTSSTSEAYSLLFKLLCDAGDRVLVPQPSYPLFEMLTRLESVEAGVYRLEHHGAWSIDRASLERVLSDTTRAVLVVSPNNPTGSMMRAADLDWLTALCAARGIALIADEVFADYPLMPREDARRVAGDRRALTFSLGGLSKSAGLPHLKLGWIVVSGPDDRIAEAINRLEVICDTYLSVSTPVQVAAPRLIEAGKVMRAAIAARVTRNLRRLQDRVGSFPSLALLEPEGGWSAVLRVPRTTSEEALVLRLLEDADVIVHPGYFFDFAEEAFLVVSLLPAPEMFDAAIARLLPIAAGAR
ncbi:MAG TPA: pyridoxal phosphate-dependent aminotransferase [Vicinamibacterales bacterium]|nr:pyridoxal phosphate-dependent aminotransferase [Vicinamibacterales bacterium]